MRYQSEDGNVRIALTGDTLISQELKTFGEKDFLELRALLLSTDVRFTNAEVLFHNYEDPPGYHQGTYMLAGTYMRCDPRWIGDLQWFGINLISCANNHAYDFGENGVLTNIRYLDQAGMAHAGTGAHLSAASMPTYINTPNGRVALVAATTSADNALAVRAADQRRDFKGRPGTNVVGFMTDWIVDPPSFDALRTISERLGWAEDVRRSAGSGAWQIRDTDGLLHLLDQVATETWASRFILGDTFGKRTSLNKDDLERNVQWVGDARRAADWVIFSVHNHEFGQTPDDPADHIKSLARSVIDAGADVFVGHGPHQDRGIEIYKGKPILYGLGNFILQNDTVMLQPQEAYLRQGLGWEATPGDFYDGRSVKGTRGQSVEPMRWESAVAIVSFEARQLSEVKLHPVGLGFQTPRSQQGRPMLATGSTAGSVLGRFKRLSEPFGTRIDIDGDVGSIVL